MPRPESPQHLEPRKSPGQSRSTETVNALLEAAARILEEQGFAGYTTNAIADRAGVSIGSLYQYFPGKDALTVALIERETATLLAAVAQARHAANCEAGLGLLIHAAVEHQMRRPALARLLDFEEARLPIGTRNARVADLIRLELVALLARDDARMNDALAPLETLAGDLLAMIKGMVDAAGEREEDDAMQLEQRVRRALFGYLAASRTPLTCQPVSNG